MATREGRAKLRRAGVDTRAQQIFERDVKRGEIVAGGVPRAAGLGG